MSNWIKCSERLPSSANEFSESDYVLAYSEVGSNSFVGWYNGKMKNWYVAHHHADITPVEGVTHWQPLPEPPEAE